MKDTFQFILHRRFGHIRMRRAGIRWMVIYDRRSGEGQEYVMKTWLEEEKPGGW